MAGTLVISNDLDLISEQDVLTQTYEMRDIKRLLVGSNVVSVRASFSFFEFSLAGSNACLSSACLRFVDTGTNAPRAVMGDLFKSSFNLGAPFFVNSGTRVYLDLSYNLPAGQVPADSQLAYYFVFDVE